MNELLKYFTERREECLGGAGPPMTPVVVAFDHSIEDVNEVLRYRTSKN